MVGEKFFLVFKVQRCVPSSIVLGRLLDGPNTISTSTTNEGVIVYGCDISA